MTPQPVPPLDGVIFRGYQQFPVSVAEEDADDHESTRTETPFVPGLLDDRIHISSNGKMIKAPQIAELKPDPKQKKRRNLLLFSSNVYNN